MEAQLRSLELSGATWELMGLSGAQWGSVRNVYIPSYIHFLSMNQWKIVIVHLFQTNFA